MNDLHTWLSQQHHGLRTFRTFQQKLDDLGNGDPGQRAMCRLLKGIVGSYVETFDEEPLPVAVADRAFQCLLDLVASLDFRASTEHRLAVIVLQRSTSGIERVKPQRRDAEGTAESDLLPKWSALRASAINLRIVSVTP